MGVSAEITSVSDNIYEITIKDYYGNILDVYTIDSTSGKGTNSADEEIVLPQTGNNVMTNWLALFAALVLIGIGLVIVKESSIIRRKEDKQ